MILIIIAACLFLFVGTTGKVVRTGLKLAFFNTIIYLGIPLFAAFMIWARVQ